jgi:hypothetical protein
LLTPQLDEGETALVPAADDSAKFQPLQVFTESPEPHPTESIELADPETIGGWVLLLFSKRIQQRGPSVRAE